ncbi:TM234 protein, partial [Todus mexicanus]|nr:TM234 protein [Todus mexicanus]
AEPRPAWPCCDLPCGAGEAAALVLVAVLWGSTGPFLRRGAAGLEEIRHRGRLQQLLAEIRFLGLNYKVRPTPGCPTAFGVIPALI